MIGASNSPMNMFTGGGNEAFQRGMMIGNANSPFATVGDALKNVVDRYHSNLSMQQEQANKIDLLKQEYALKRANVQPDPDAAGPVTQVDPATGKSFYRSTTIDPSTGAQRVSWAPVSINAPEDPVTTYKRQVMGPMLERMNQPQGAPAMATASPIPGMPSNVPVPQVTGAGQPKQLDAHTAQSFLAQAGGDKNKARAMAQQQGYTF